jgi:hypothetical protein
MTSRYRSLVLVAVALIFSTGLLTLLPGAAAAYPSRAGQGGFQADVSHLALTLEDQSLWVALEIDVVNNGKEPSTPFEIPIPGDATSFESVDGSLTRNADRVSVPGGTPAGAKASIGFRYKLPPGVFQVPFPDTPPAALSMVMLDESVLTLVSPTGKGVTDQGIIALGTRAYRELDVTRPAPGMTLTVQVKPGGNPTAANKAIADAEKNAPTTGQASQGGNPNEIMWQRITSPTGMVVIGLVLAAVIALFVWRARAAARANRPVRAYHSEDEPDDEGELESLRRQKVDLARRIARMDKKAATSPSADLARRRGEAKQRLVQVILRLKRQSKRDLACIREP